MAKAIEITITKTVQVTPEMVKERFSGDPEVLQRWLKLFNEIRDSSELFSDDLDKFRDTDELRSQLEEFCDREDEEVEFEVML